MEAFVLSGVHPDDLAARALATSCVGVGPGTVLLVERQ